MNLKRFSAVMLSLCLLTGCGGNDDKEIAVEDLTGTWIQTLSDGTETLTLKSDMTYIKVIELGGAFPVTTTTDDTWSVSGDTISINYSKYDTVSEYKIELDGNKMIWDSGDSKITYNKKS